MREPTPEQRQGLDKAKAIALHHGYGHKLEYKIASLALHTRGLENKSAMAMERNLSADWGGIASLYDLECRQFNGGVEIRCSGWHKGDVVAELLRRQAKDVLAVYVGDDETDEDAFRIVGKSGIGIKVGEPSRQTAAQGFLPDCRAVERFLRVWIRLASPPGKTLTRNEMTVTTIITPDAAYVVDGAGYEPRGSFALDNTDLIPPATRCCCRWPPPACSATTVACAKNRRAGAGCSDGRRPHHSGTQSGAH